jgi:hypothetical protein
VFALAAGSVQPSAGQIITVSGAFNGTLTRHFDYSLNGTVSVIGPVTAFYAEWWGAKADYVASPATDSCIAINAALAQGGTTQLLKGAYYSSCTLQLLLPSQHLLGEGKGDITPATSATTIVFSANVAGVVIGTSGVASTVEYLTLYSLNAGAAHAGAYGLQVRAGSTVTNQVAIVRFGDHGWYAVTDNVNQGIVEGSLFYGNAGDGWRCDSPDCNLLTVYGIRSYNNGGLGFNLVQGSSNRFFTVNATGNVGGGYYIGGISNYLDTAYCEGGAVATIAGTHNTFNSPFFGKCTAVNTGGVSNLIQESNGITGPLTVSGNFTTNGDAVFGTSYKIAGNQINVQAGAATTGFAMNFAGKADQPMNLYNGGGVLKVRLNPTGSSLFQGGSASMVACWKSDGVSIGYATVAEIEAGTCH